MSLDPMLYSTGIYMFKVNNRNTRARCEICSKLTIKTGVFIFNFKHISHLSFSFVNFEHVNAGWVVTVFKLCIFYRLYKIVISHNVLRFSLTWRKVFDDHESSADFIGSKRFLHILFRKESCYKLLQIHFLVLSNVIFPRFSKC